MNDVQVGSSVVFRMSRAGQLIVRRGAELLVEDQAAGRMQPSPPVVGAREVPLEDADLDPRVRRSADIVPELREVVADAPQPGLEILGLVLVVVNAEDVEVLSGEVDDLLAPDHVVGALLSARHDSRLGSDGRATGCRRR